jgi:hypothetical protein
MFSVHAAKFARLGRRAVTTGLCAVMLTSAAVAQGLSDAQRARAADKTAKTHPLCSVDLLRSFYWEIGDVNGVRAAGRVGGRVGQDSTFNVGSATKWLYAAHAVERFGAGVDVVPYLNFTSGYSAFDSTQCPDDGTVEQCLPGPQNAAEAAAGIFHYDGGHLQQHAIVFGLGPLRNAGLASEVRSVIGPALDLRFTKPQPAGGANTNARNYAEFLRRLLVDSPQPLALGALLGSHAVCTLPGPDCVASSSLALPEAWHYSLGHWVEDDPVTTPPINRAYSSPGLFGFYPWVDRDRRVYGILSRNGLDIANEAYRSAQCGRLIRLAWKTGKPVAPAPLTALRAAGTP